MSNCPGAGNLIVPDNFDGSGGTLTPSSGFTQLGQVMLGGAPYKFSKLSNNICHWHTDGNYGSLGSR